MASSITILGSYVYVVSSSSNCVFQIDSSTLLQVKNGTIKVGVYYNHIVGYSNSLCIVSDEFITLLNISTLVVSKWVYTVNYGQNYLAAGTADSTHAYFTSSNVPADIVKIDMKTFTKVKAAKLSGLALISKRNFTSLKGIRESRWENQRYSDIRN